MHFPTQLQHKFWKSSFSFHCATVEKQAHCIQFWFLFRIKPPIRDYCSSYAFNGYIVFLKVKLYHTSPWKTHTCWGTWTRRCQIIVFYSHPLTQTLPIFLAQQFASPNPHIWASTSLRDVARCSSALCNIKATSIYALIPVLFKFQNTQELHELR